MNKLQERLLKLAREMGLPGLIGVVLLMAAAWGQWQWVPQQQTALDDLSSQVRHLRHDLQSTIAQEPNDRPRSAWDVRGLAPEAAWQAVWDALPDAAERIHLLGAVTTSAAKLGVQPPSIQYQGKTEPWSMHGGQALWRQRMTMPIEGRYGDVRAWLGTLLMQPDLSLDAMDLARSDTTSDVVKGQISLSLWWRVSTGGKP